MDSSTFFKFFGETSILATQDHSFFWNHRYHLCATYRMNMNSENVAIDIRRLNSPVVHDHDTIT